MRERFNLNEAHKRIDEMKPIKYNDTLQKNEEVRQMKQALINGNKNILKGIFPESKSTTYMENFKGNKEKFKMDNKPDFYTSGIKGKIPDPFELKRINTNREINLALKGRVKNILTKHYL